MIVTPSIKSSLTNARLIREPLSSVMSAAGVVLLCCAAMLVCVASAWAQNIGNPQSSFDYKSRSGLHVDPVTHALQLQLTLGQYPQRGGGTLPVTLFYSSKLWQVRFVESTMCQDDPFTAYSARYARSSAAGWTSSLDWFIWPEDVSLETYDGNTHLPAQKGTVLQKIARVHVTLPDGSRHELRQDDDVHPESYSAFGRFYAVDGSRLVYDNLPDEQTLYLPDGSRYVMQMPSGIRSKYLYIDRNGNTITYDYSTGQWTDTLGRTFGLPLAGGAGDDPSLVDRDSPYSIPGVNNTQLTYTFRWRRLSEVIDEAETDKTERYKGDRPSLCTGMLQPGQTLFHSSMDAGNDVLLEQALFDPVVLYQIALPNGGQSNPPAYTFKYNIYGEMTRIIYPTGGYERFAYAQAPALSGHLDVTLAAQANRGVTDAWVSAKGDGSDEEHWQYSADFSTTAPDGTRTERSVFTSSASLVAYGFDNPLVGKAYEERTYAPGATYGANGPLLRRNLTRWQVDGALVSYNLPAYKQRNPRVVKQVEIILDNDSGTAANALAQTTEYQYDANLNPISTIHYAFTGLDSSQAQTIGIEQAQPGAKLRTDESLYLLDDPNYSSVQADYRARNLLALPTSKTVKDGQDNVIAQTLIDYDKYPADYPLLDGYSGTGWSDPQTNTRGNATGVKHWLDFDGVTTSAYPSGTYLHIDTQFDKCGNVRNTWDATSSSTGRGRQTQIAYDSLDVYPQTVTSPIPDPTGTHGTNSALITTNIYDISTGLLMSTTDANGQVSGKATTYSYSDPLNRLTSITYPNAGQTNYAYSDTVAGNQSGNNYLRIRTKIDTSRWTDAYQYFDGLGRASRTFTYDGDQSGPWTVTDTHYDKMGHVRQVSNPYRVAATGSTVPDCSPSIPCNATSYDALGRVKSVTGPDGSQVTTSYDVTIATPLGSMVTVKDQAQNGRRSVTDALGRLVQVTEDPGDSPAHFNYLTSYGYDALGNLRTVTQDAQTRSFVYDSLSRLTSATNPESGTVQYQYDDKGNLVLKIDPRVRPGNLALSPCPLAYTGNHIATCYDYDALNRIKTRTYNDGTPNVSYVYDTLANGRGRLSSVSTSVSATSYGGYDDMGRVTSSTQTTDGQSYSVSHYGYDLMGNLTSETYPSGRVISTAYDDAGRLAALTGQQVGEQPKTYADSMSYWPSGAPKDLRLGNQLWEHTELNQRLQPTEIDLGAQPGAVDRLKLSYTYESLTGNQSNHDNNGNLLSQSITVPQIGTVQGFSSTQTYQYDAVNRLTSAEELSGSMQLWKQSYSYANQSGQNSQYGNRRIDTAHTTANVLPSLNPSINPLNNRFDDNQGYSYDEAGNVTAAPNQSFSYDAENKQVSYNGGNPLVNNGASYSYDGDGRRVRKADQSGTTIYVYDALGKMVAEYSNTTQANAETDKTSYLTSDTLGTPRVITGSNGQVKARHDYLPFGEEVGAEVGGRTTNQGYSQLDNIRQKFTGYERDNETGLDYAEARYYSSTMGRFTSIDPKMASARIWMPQSWNRYSYVLNNPLRYIDPLGNQDQDPNKLPKPDKDNKLVNPDGTPYVLPPETVTIKAKAPKTPEILGGGWGDGIAPIIGGAAGTVAGGGAAAAGASGGGVAGAAGAGGLAGSGGGNGGNNGNGNDGDNSNNSEDYPTIDPFQVRFSQDSISNTFQNGITIDQLAEGLRNGSVPPNAVPPIRVVESNLGMGADGQMHLITLDNRRLEAFRRANVPVPYVRVPPEVAARELARKFTTKNGGTSIRVRRGRN